MLEEADLELFPDDVVRVYRDGPEGRAKARLLLWQAIVHEADPDRQKRQRRWLAEAALWGHTDPDELDAGPPDEDPVPDLVAFLGRYLLWVGIGVFGAWLALGKIVGSALGSGPAGILVAFWGGLLALALVLIRSRTLPTGLTRQVVVVCFGLSGSGLGLLGLSRLLFRGTGTGELLAMAGLLLTVLPLAALLNRVLFGAPPEDR